jgi:PKD repeat protein
MIMKTAIRSITIILILFPALLQAQDPPAPCEAFFTYVPDTTNILVYNFYDQSTGNITDYSWDFGDGSTASGQILSHAFPGIGTYQVCLTVSNNDTLDPCTDSICVIIDLAPQQSYLLGGLLYAGNFPINNPFNSGDVGYAFLYRILDNNFIPADTVEFDTLGYFYFTSVPEGSYIIKGGLAEGSVHFGDYLPGYHDVVSRWQEADPVTLDADYFMAHVHMYPLLDLPSGVSHLEGYVVADDSKGVAGRTAGCEVILRDSAGQPVKIAYTDASGAFRFDFLPEGSYSVVAEYTGLWSETVNVTLDPVQPVADSIEVRLHFSPQATGEPAVRPAFEVHVFPNPASGELNIDIRTVRPQELRYDLIGSQGQTLVTREILIPAGTFLEKMAVSGTPPGIYILRTSNIQTGEAVSVRVVIR